MLKNPIDIDKAAISKVNLWKDWIIAPKLDGVRALLIFYNTSVYLLFEMKLELLIEHCNVTGNMVFETEIYNHGIYIYDLHFYV